MYICQSERLLLRYRCGGKKDIEGCCVVRQLKDDFEKKEAVRGMRGRRRKNSASHMFIDECLLLWREFERT